MRFLFFPAALLLCGAASAQSVPPPDPVVIKSFAFGPHRLTVRAGTKVTWVNKDSELHTVVSSDHMFQSEALDTNQTFSVTFDTAGTFGYFCSLHPHMTGTVTVMP